MKTTSNILLSVVTFALLIAAVSCGTDSAETQTHQHSEQKQGQVVLTRQQCQVAGIRTGRFEKRTIGAELQVSGMIDVPPRSKISITVPYGGFIKSNNMLPGSKVKKGQLLAVIENPEFIRFQQEYREALANRDYLKAEFERQQQLFSENVASGKNFQQARSQYLSNEARISALEERLRLVGYDITKISEGRISAAVNIYSPVNGSVLEVFANPGKFVAPTDVIMNVTDASDLHVELTVYENDIAHVKEGQKIRFTLANAPHEWKAAKVFLVGSGVREDRSVTVHGHLEHAYDDLRPGMFVTARIETDSREAWTVPEASLVRHNGKHLVFILPDDTMALDSIHRFEMLEVTKGVTEDGLTEVQTPGRQPELEKLRLVTSGALTILAEMTKGTGGEDH